MDKRRPPRLELRLLKQPVHLLALGFGSGLSPFAPGTFGSLLAVPLTYAISVMPLVPAIAVVCVSLAAGIWICGESARRLDTHDHPGIVWDEIAAMALLGLFLPDGWVWLVLGFVLFRCFDIWKPWPIRDLDHRLRGGLGIMLDDVVASAFAALSIRLIEFLTTVI
jgi:phosphatidylglycerophosphatase A